MIPAQVARGANVNAQAFIPAARGREADVRTPLSMARKTGHATVVAFLIASGAR